MLKKCFFAALLLSSSTAFSQVDKTCEANFSVDGSFFTGKTFKTWQDTSGVTFDIAFKKVAQAIAEAGWGSVNAQKDMGIITATQSVTAGNGAVVPLNVVITEEKDKSIRVKISFAIAAGQMTSEDTVKKELCKFVQAPAS